MGTAHEGLATRVPFEMPLQILWRLLDDLVLVDDGEIEEAIRWYARDARLVAEGAAAAPLAAAALLRPSLKGQAGGGRAQRRQPSPRLLCRRARRRRIRMSDSFQPLDLTGLCNAGTRNVDLGGGRWLWPHGADPHETALDGLPAGECLFLGVPFHLAAADVDRRFVAAAAGEGAEPRVSIPVGARARRLLFAHLCATAEGEWATLEGAGETLGRYLVRFADGSETDQPLRRRWEIHDINAPWGHHPFLCRNCRHFDSTSLHEPAVGYGGAQVGVYSRYDRADGRPAGGPGAMGGDLTGWWLFDLAVDRPEIGDRRGRPRGRDADAHRPRCGHPVPRGGRPLPLGAAAHRGGDRGGRRGGPGDRRRPGGDRAPGRPLRPRRRLPDHGRGRLGPGRTAGRGGRPGRGPRVAPGQPGGELGGGRRRLPLGRGPGARRGRVRTGARPGGRPRGPAVGARARRRRRHGRPRGLPRPLPLEGGGLPRPPRPPGRRQHRLVRGHGGRLQDGRHPVRLHRRDLPDRAARGGQLRRGGARLRLRAGPPAAGDQARAAAPDPVREARLRHEGRGLVLRRHPRPLPLLPVERPRGRGGGPERGPPAGQPVGAAVHQLGGVHRRRGPHVDGEPPRLREPGEPPARPRPHQPAGPAGAGGPHVHRRPPGGLGRRRDPGPDGRLGGAVPGPGGPGHHAPHAGARLRERRQHRPRPGGRGGDVLGLGRGGDRPGRARLLPLAERGPEAAHRRRHRQDVERPHPRGLADLCPDPRGPGVHLRQLVPGGALRQHLRQHRRHDRPARRRRAHGRPARPARQRRHRRGGGPGLERLAPDRGGAGGQRRPPGAGDGGPRASARSPSRRRSSAASRAGSRRAAGGRTSPTPAR